MRKIAALCLIALWAASGLCAEGLRELPHESGIRCCLLTDATGIDDKAFNAAAWRGILAFYGDTWNHTKYRGVSYDVITARTQDRYIPYLRQATDKGYDLIVTVGFTAAGALEEVARDNPRQKYLIIDLDSLRLDAPNIMQAAYTEHEGSFLVGAAAALKARADGIENPRFGFIGGMPGDIISKYETGYAQGILAVIPDAEMVVYYVNSWADPVRAKTQAKNWYDSGVYAIYSAAGGSGMGVIAQAREYRAAGRNVWAIGVDSDQYEEGRYNDRESAVLTAMLKRIDTSLVYALNAVSNGTFSGGVTLFDIKAGGVDYAAVNPALDGDIVNQLEAIKKDMVDGTIKVAATHEQAGQIPGFPRNLRAMDD
jgi:basic membrane protein A